MTAIPDFTMRQLAYLVAVADEGTISGAAQRLHVSASAVSDALTSLEKVLGGKLTIRRRAHGVRLTAMGQQIVADGRHLIAQANEISNIAQSRRGELSGPITVGCYPTLAPTILPRILHDFGSAHPEVELHIFEGTHDVLARPLATGEIDVAFMYDTLVPGTPHRARLFEARAHVIIAEDDPYVDYPAISLEQLVERDLILLDAPPSSTHTLSLFTDRGLRPRIRHRTSSYEVVRTLVGRGLGYGILVQRPENPFSYEGRRLITKEIVPEVAPNGIDAIWPTSVPPTQRTLALIEFATSLDWQGSIS